MITLLISLTMLNAALLVGNEFAVAAVIHPALKKLPDEAHILGVQKIGKFLGSIMPFWMPLTAILCLISTFLVAPAFGSIWYLFAAATLCVIAAIVFGFYRNVPINNQIIKWNVNDLPENWRELRQTWDAFHNVRTAILVVGLVCLFLGAINADSVL